MPSSKKPKQATRADVARLAGVSESTVSYALTGVRPISEETRERIESAMKELGYVPNAMAQALAGKRSGILALLFPVGERGFNETDFEYVQAANEAVAEDGYQLLLWPNAVEDIESLKKIVNQGLVDGVLLMEVRSEDPRVPVLIEAGMPFCLIGRTEDPSKLTYVDADFSQWGPLAIRHLGDLGHKQVGYIGIADELINVGYGPGVRTETGLHEEAGRAGITLHPKHVAATIRAGRAAMEELLTSTPPVTAVISLNESAMVGALEVLASHDLSIPEQFSVMSFGISEIAANMTVPSQTTIGVEGKDLGRMADQYLIARLNGDNKSVLQHLSAPVFADRGSTGPAPE
ncbi:LacI family DNA-binding transcriptional regulator [Aurantimicrobium minutum]|uniref:LacI family DNA-binding transcriptional regulator n=1 Tax=Aurantimicrobium minutum TaxID=708131 RepID=UPI00247546A1|nr:LacI family DNA-binding transcriptional regulator [Aurantimicrobium minutum]MDH6422401.1 DNA-binding LacI/PurR family transcriptional regulator [Aurantimicrobium minutum]